MPSNNITAQRVPLIYDNKTMTREWYNFFHNLFYLAGLGKFYASVTATLDFPNTSAQTNSDLTVSVPGAVDGDEVTLTVPAVSMLASSCYNAWVSAPDTVTVRFNNYSSGALNPSSGDFRVVVRRY